MAFYTGKEVYQIQGIIATEPELRYLQEGTPVVNFNIPINTRVKKGDGTWGDGPAKWLRCTWFGKQAEAKIATLHKGDVVAIVSFEVSARAWISNKDGTAQCSMNVNVDQLAMLKHKSPVNDEEAQGETAPVAEAEADEDVT